MGTRVILSRCITILFLTTLGSFSDTESISPNLTFVRGAVNGVLINQNGKTLAIYGDPRELPAAPEKVLFTHCRRDVVWAGRSFARRGAEAIAPVGEKDYFTSPNSFWQKLHTARFHDYEQQSVKVPVESISNVKSVKGGDVLDWQGLKIQVLDTPGYTRGSVSYLFDLDGQKIACVGDLIFSDGKLLDIYSLQDAIPKTNAGGYHGYMARAADLITSLQTISSASPDILIPARGPAIRDSHAAIARLISRIQAVYRNYLSINALRWYWGDDHIRTCAARILGTTEVEWMANAETVQPYPPEWIIPIGTSRLILSQSGDGFLVDCGSPETIREIQKMQQEKKVKNIEGIFITHYHDDHTNQMVEGVETFKCPLYLCAEEWDICTHPNRLRMPCQPEKPAQNFLSMQEGETKRWQEFELTFSYYPGQTIYHGGLLVKKDNGETIFFIGDSFTPSGLDDYCALNRNLLRPDTGFLYCLDVLKSMKPDYLLINEHVKEPFRFSPHQLDFMVKTLEERIDLFRDLFPWDDVNYGLDEQWAKFYPYSIEATAGQRNNLNVAIYNYSAKEQTFMVTPHAPRGWEIAREPLSVSIPAREQRSVTVFFTPPADARGVGVLTADVAFGEWDLRDWAEGLVNVKK